MGNDIFERIEKKYRINGVQNDALLQGIGSRLLEDKFCRSTIQSLYLDTPDHRIIRKSIEAKGCSAYKEKLRVRSYGTPGPEDKVFFELKKKYKGIVYKRRTCMTLSEAERYLEQGILPEDSQIMREIDYAMNYYGRLRPAVMICYEREAYAIKDYPALRITFDSGVRYRDRELSLGKGSQGIPITGKDEYLLEIKSDGALPLWLTEILDRNKVFPSPSPNTAPLTG
jgi:SPX domain protein involved in polyphosphate accumulation